MADPAAVSVEASPAPLLAALPALPPPTPAAPGAGGASQSPATAATPASTTASTTSKARSKGKGAGGAARKAEDAPDGEPKPKKKRTAAAKKVVDAGPGKHWRKGLKGNLAGVGLDPTGAATIQGGTTPGAGSPAPVGASSSAFALASSPGPSRGSTAGIVSSAIAPPPKLGNQFIAVQALHIGTPRPRKWIKNRMAFKKPDGRVIMLPSWQGDSYSAFATAVGTTAAAAAEAEVDELASPPPVAPSNLAAATAAFSHPSRPSLAESQASSSSNHTVVPKLEPSLNVPVLPPLPPVAAAAAGATSAAGDGLTASASKVPAPGQTNGTEGVRVEEAPAEQKMQVDASAAGLVPAVDASATGLQFVPSEAGAST
ncbi:hypothetical protein JCM10908_005352 [Rhodotorula pacifica]|uniref:uncharacterized protein n=1 Tax=Rhodotorula pacifica TaxID=1495444 RepID=UPI0031806901